MIMIINYASLIVLFATCTYGIHVYYDKSNVKKFESYLSNNLTKFEKNYVAKIIEANDEVPRPCRTDLCDRGEEFSYRKGTVKWRDTLAGHRLRILCPFAIYEPVYIERSCLLNFTEGPYWDKLDIEACPEPPLAQLIERLTAETENRTKVLTLEYHTDVLTRIQENLKNYPNEPIHYMDIENIMPFIFDAMDQLISSAEYISRPTTSVYLDILDFFLNNHQGIFEAILQETDRLGLLAHQLNILPLSIKPPEDETSWTMQTEHFALSQHIVDLFSDVISINVMHDSWNEMFPDVYLTVPNLSTGEYLFGTVVLKDMALLYNYNFEKAKQYPNKRSLSISKEENASDESNMFVNDTAWAIIPTKGQIGQNKSIDLYGEYHFDTLELVTFGPVERNQTYIDYDYVLSKDKDYDDTYEDFNLDGYGDHYFYENYFNPFQVVEKIEPHGYMILVGMLQNGVIVENSDVSVHYEMKCSDDDCYLDDEEQICVKLNGENTWTNESCITTHVDNYTVTCTCTGLGQFGSVLLDYSSHWHHDRYAPIYPDIIDIELDIASFMGFTYRRNLAIAGMVLNGISLICLFATIFSYCCIRRARRGRTTAILLNLCVALIILSLALFFVEFLVKVRMGCTIANIIRYYLVFVTLLWNSVEAFHMYLMLVKVFQRRQIRHFVYKAAALAWGIPGLMIALCMAISTKAFNGYYEVVEEYTEVDGICIYKCALRRNMLYFGYLIPMILIIIHNFVVFILVLRVILSQGQMVANKKRSRLVQLAGIAATLVLLGVPWIFSAFGALEVKDNAYLGAFEGAIQVVFVLFINLQGMFIFIFHCARNNNIRESWSSAVSRATRSSTYTSGSTKNTSTSAKSHSQGHHSLTGHNAPEKDLPLTNIADSNKIDA